MRKRAKVDIQNAGEKGAHHSLRNIHDGGLVQKRRLNIDLCKFRLPVCPQVLVAETFGYLIIAIKARHHQQLLEQLGRLRQGKEFAGMGPARDQVVAGTLWRRPGKDGRLDIEKTLVFEKTAHCSGNLRAHDQPRLHFRAAQVHVAEAEPYFLTHGSVFIELERRCLGAVEDVQLLAEDLDGTGCHRWIDGCIAARTNAARDPQHVLTAHPVSARKVLLGVRIEYHLDDAFAVSHIQKNDAAVVAATVYPAA